MPRGNTKSTKKKTTAEPKVRRERRQQRERYIDPYNTIEEMPRRTWSLHDLANINPLTDRQADMFHEFFEGGQNILAYGSAGTGKTFVALYLALCDILTSATRRNNIIIVRSAVQTRDMGYMPGDLNEKISLYETPYRDTLYELFHRYNTYDDMKRYGLIQFCTTSFVRSLTWCNAIVIMDEVQNMTFHEINSTVTRLGEHSRVIALGDVVQNDLASKRNELSGMERFIRVAQAMPTFSAIQFTRDDIVRSEFVKAWIIAVENTP